MLAIDEQIVDVFRFVRRKELDTLQIVSRRFNAIVENNLTVVCLRVLKSATISRCSAQRQFVLVMDEVGSNKLTRLPTGVDDEAAANTLLLKACQSSRVDSLRLYGTTSMSADFFDSLALCAPTIFLKNFCMQKRTLSENVPHDRVLRVLQTFAELQCMLSTDEEDTNLQLCLLRSCFKADVTLDTHVHILDKKCDIAIVEDAVMEFCFSACDDQFATRERSLRMQFSKPMRTDFMQRWVEVSA